MDAALDYYNPDYTYSSFSNESINYENVSEEISSHDITDYGEEESNGEISMFAICVLGAVGNGAVIWLLGFRIKRNPFTTYILNLAVADLGVLLSVPFLLDLWPVSYGIPIMPPVFFFLFFLTYGTSQFLLTTISIDRCIAVFFPLWHRCHRPPHLSTIVCTLIWFLSLLLTSLTYTLVFLNDETMIKKVYQFLVNALLCLPVMTMATMALFVRVCFKTRQQRRGKLLTVILLALLFYLFFAFPLNVIIILYLIDYVTSYVFYGAFLLVCLNSSVNPAIYILVGRQWKSRQKENMKMIFQKVFKEEDRWNEETPVETQL